MPYIPSRMSTRVLLFRASRESGIFVGGNNDVVERNTITEAAVGILKMTGTTGNLILNNRVFGAPITVQASLGGQAGRNYFAAAIAHTAQ